MCPTMHSFAVVLTPPPSIPATLPPLPRSPMPPPRTVEKAVGERRLFGHSPVGISVCPELDVEAVLEGIGE